MQDKVLSNAKNPSDSKVNLSLASLSATKPSVQIIDIVLLN